MSKPKKKDYTVGYGKPPEHTRFKAGQSGNPKGRPKATLTLATAVNRAVREKVVIVENGERKRITKLDALVKALVNRAVKGDPKATQQLLALGPSLGIEPVAGTPAIDANDAAVIELLKLRFPTTASSPAKPSKARKVPTARTSRK